MPQLKIQDVQNELREFKESFKGKTLDTVTVIQKITEIVQSLESLEAQLRDHVDMYNRHIQDLHINNDN